MKFKLFNFSITRAFFILMLATATNVEQDLEIIERSKLHKIKFYEALEAQRLQDELVGNKGEDDSNGGMGRRLFSTSEYDRLIEEIEVAKNKTGTKTSREYNLLANYEIYAIAGLKKIIAKRKGDNADIKYLVHYDEVFDAIERCHKNIGHRGYF